MVLFLWYRERENLSPLGKLWAGFTNQDGSCAPFVRPMMAWSDQLFSIEGMPHQSPVLITWNFDVNEIQCLCMTSLKPLIDCHEVWLTRHRLAYRGQSNSFSSPLPPCAIITYVSWMLGWNIEGSMYIWPGAKWESILLRLWNICQPATRPSQEYGLNLMGCIYFLWSPP